ncbi:DUF5776 domain-containing protein [Levilactobacillus parabrevis]|uniref:DUF5776 domain-containing protein n=1 Tax=Levilactobacillus parabrevis TaxID=357278 RepID=UPI0021A59003|nr:DUF5776 domain-containing protein [Levilactobacillus parabrevis]MCT4488173.1 BspA family leucine-rich repeat surface protein [Levilactobacillus parabrevis]MCT4490557.1 BspA family leucine-rich repeat surface protein [Levilactobacillus parabrevis]
MKKSVSILLVALALGVGQPLSLLATGTGAPVAQAAAVKADSLASGQYGEVVWALTADGTLHLGAGQLGEPDNLITNTGQMATQIVLAQGGTPTMATTQAAADLVTTVVLDGKVSAPKDATGLFRQFRNVTAYKGLNQLDTSQTTNLSGMFAVSGFDGQVTSIDVSEFDTSQVTSLDWLFYGQPQLSQVDVSHFDTGQVRTMTSMFNGDQALKTVDFAAGTFANLVSAMFVFGSSGVQTIKLPKFAPPISSSSSYMFSNASNLSELTLGPATFFRGSPYLRDAKANEQYTGLWQAVADGTTQNPLGEKFAKGDEVTAQYMAGADRPTMVETYVWEPVERVILPPVTPPNDTAAPVTVRYLDERGKPLAAEQTLTGKLGAAYTAEQLVFDGYKLAKAEGQVSGTFSKFAQMVTFNYEPDLVTGGGGATVVPVRGVVYATKKIGLYRTKNFSDGSRQMYYTKKSRTQRPMFVVTGYATSKAGNKRYKVRDVNHHSKTAGKTGYITAKKNYVSSVYYAKKQTQIRVINAKGINGYSKAALTGKAVHYRKGQVLKVKKIVKYRQTTRFVLTNGKYVTANKKLVIAE